jgi:hypothetical protein
LSLKSEVQIMNDKLAENFVANCRSSLSQNRPKTSNGMILELELILPASIGRVLPVLHLDPVLGPASLLSFLRC